MEKRDFKTGKKILAVDDEIAALHLLVDALKEEQYVVYTAADGKQGLEAARQKIPDVIILDVTMPKMDGFQVLQELKKDKRTMNIPVVMLTGRSEPENMEKGMHHFAESYISKPFQLEHLLKEIEKILAIRYQDRGVENA